jgi:hypothetical protein
MNKHEVVRPQGLENDTHYVRCLPHVINCLLLTAKRDSLLEICRLRPGFPICVCLQRESELRVTQELALQSRSLGQVRYFWYTMCDLSRNISVVPNPMRVYTSRIHWVPCGTGTPEDRDEVNSREVFTCDG